MGSATGKNVDEVSDLLKRLQDSGAEVKSGGKQGTAVTHKILDDIKGGASKAFDAWVSWTKSF